MNKGICGVCLEMKDDLIEVEGYITCRECGDEYRTFRNHIENIMSNVADEDDEALQKNWAALIEQFLKQRRKQD
ncbi:hypothetical protein [Salimicrobium halophilum]|uniref:Uncharacterized protein n=1 Tax=Salimicrobium halophilum TaxID=86666 RepID=A0A1G8WEG8_9BACI|nr:hypothetical protein [Salimicrobium halophilum]SDJ76682.1 hypothetical protein SAMN04490247_3156 [Salimicrobium halophilum]